MGSFYPTRPRATPGAERAGEGRVHPVGLPSRVNVALAPSLTGPSLGRCWPWAGLRTPVLCLQLLAWQTKARSLPLPSCPNLALIWFAPCPGPDLCYQQERGACVTKYVCLRNHRAGIKGKHGPGANIPKWRVSVSVSVRKKQFPRAGGGKCNRNLFLLLPTALHTTQDTASCSARLCVHLEPF